MAETILNFRASNRFTTSGGHKITRLSGIMGTMGDMIRSAMQVKSYALLRECMQDISGNLGRQLKHLGYANVTGNLSASLGVALVGANPKSGHLTVLHSAPINTEGSGVKVTRESLGKKEAYKEPTYADGYPVTDKNRYIGQTDRGAGTYGRDQRMDYVNSLRGIQYAGREKIYSLYIFAAMPYASFVNMKKGKSHDYFRNIKSLALEQFKRTISNASYLASLNQ